MSYLPHRDAAWALFDERLGEIAELSGRPGVADQRGLGLDGVNMAIESLRASLSKQMRARVSTKLSTTGSL